MLGKRPGVDDSGDPQRSPEGATPLRQREARRVGMHMRPPPRQSTGRIGQEPEPRAAAGRDNT
jgi:hypothetical protein